MTSAADKVVMKLIIQPIYRSLEDVSVRFAITEISQMAAKSISMDNPDRKKVVIKINNKLTKLELTREVEPEESAAKR